MAWHKHDERTPEVILPLHAGPGYRADMANITGCEERDGKFCPTLDGKPLLHDQAGNAVWFTREQLQKFLDYGVPALTKALAQAAKAGK